MTGRDSITLWEETIEALKENEKDWENVYWICIGDKRMFKQDFEEYAKRIHYRPWCFGGNTINLGLRLYGFDFVLYRSEYDGSERWNFMPTQAPSECTMTEDPSVMFDPCAWKYWRKGFEKENLK